MANICSSSSSSNYNVRRRRASLKSMAEPAAPAAAASSMFFCDETQAVQDQPHHFLDNCFRCKTPIHLRDDIYMYKGNIPFCTEECREEQIEIDEDEEKKMIDKYKKMTVMMTTSKLSSSNSSSRSHEVNHVRPTAATTTVVAVGMS